MLISGCVLTPTTTQCIQCDDIHDQRTRTLSTSWSSVLPHLEIGANTAESIRLESKLWVTYSIYNSTHNSTYNSRRIWSPRDARAIFTPDVEKDLGNRSHVNRAANTDSIENCLSHRVSSRWAPWVLAEDKNLNKDIPISSFKWWVLATFSIKRVKIFGKTRGLVVIICNNKAPTRVPIPGYRFFRSRLAMSKSSASRDGYRSAIKMLALKSSRYFWKLFVLLIMRI